MSRAASATLGVILAGGRAIRMGGGDKALLDLVGEPLVAHIARRLAPQCARVLLNANGDKERFQAVNLEVVADPLPGQPGPLAGILAGLEWAAAHAPSVEWVVSVPADTPFIPADLVERLHAARLEDDARMACAASSSGRHHAVALWPVAMAADLRRAVEHDGIRSIRDWSARYPGAQATWNIEPDPFFNINTPADLDAARLIAAGHRKGAATP